VTCSRASTKYQIYMESILRVKSRSDPFQKEELTWISKRKKGA
jgi:hypothetical protein